MTSRVLCREPIQKPHSGGQYSQQRRGGFHLPEPSGSGGRQVVSLAPSLGEIILFQTVGAFPYPPTKIVSLSFGQEGEGAISSPLDADI